MLILTTFNPPQAINHGLLSFGIRAIMMASNRSLLWGRLGQAACWKQHTPQCLYRSVRVWRTIFAVVIDVLASFDIAQQSTAVDRAVRRGRV